MNMCLLEVAMCEKCRNSHFQLEGGVKVAGNCCCLLLHRVSLQNSGAKCISNYMPKCFHNFSVCFGNTSAKKLAKTQQKPLYITSAIAFTYLCIFLKGYVLVF